jgi:dihydroneopterin aldolase
MDTLTLKNIRIKGNHGFYEKERQNGNNFEVDLIFTADLQEAAESDRLEDTIDYQQAVTIVENIIKGPSQKLIESLTKKIGDQLFNRFPRAEKLKVAVRKLHPPVDTETDYSEISMSWQRSS